MRRSLLAAAACAGLVVALPVAAQAADLPAPTSTSPIAGDPSGSGRPVLTGIRTGRHDEYDRTVFDFSGGTPGWRVAYAPLVEQGRGNTIPVAGAATLLVVFTDAGTPAVDLGTVYDVNLPTLRQIKSGGFFEGRASFGLGVRDRTGFRVLVLHGPDRIAVDVAHQPTQAFTAEPFSHTGDASGTVVRAVRAGGHPGYDRIVFDLAGTGWPTLEAAYLGSGPTIRVRFTGTERAAGVPAAITFGRPALRSVTVGRDGATTTPDIMTADITTAYARGFRVMLLDSPARVVVDVAS
nr:hypothetical protein GCM10020063_018540 [Dactylosporangium thailandense]